MLLNYIQPCFFNDSETINFITENEYEKTSEGLELKAKYDYDNCHRLQNLTFENLFKIVDVINSDFPGLLKFDVSKVNRDIFMGAAKQSETKLREYLRGTF